ncbi:MAG TPA: ion channel, partial [Syntrophales bacterium]|nr:ion channel [Syntrophales bacterium]
MKPIHRHVMRFWSEDRSLTAFLILLVVEIFIIAPMNLAGLAIGLVNNFLFSLLLLAGLLTVTRQKALQSVLAMFVAMAVATHFARLVFGMTGLDLLDGLLMLACTIGFLVIVLWQVYREGPVTIHRIQGAIAAYLLLSIIFAVAYSQVESLHPGSFQMPPAQAGHDVRLNQTFYYFSVVTLTTAGFGDITAVNPFARTLVMMEAL